MHASIPNGSEQQIRLILVDSHVLFRESLARLLSAEPGLEVAGEAGNCTEALDLLNRESVDLVLVDFDLGPEHGNEFISAARKAGYAARFLVLTEVVDGNASAMAIRLGASGIFLKSKSVTRLVRAVKLVALGEFWVDAVVLQLLARRYPQQDGFEKPLTERERDVLESVIQGLTNKRIGSRIGRSEGAVKAILQQLFAKAGVRTRGQLVRIALESTARNRIDSAHAG